MKSLLIYLPCLIVLLAPASLTAAPSGDELLAALQVRIDQDGDVDEIYDAVEDLPIAELTALQKKVDKVWPRLRDKYLSDFQRVAKDSSGDARENRSRIRDLRKELAALKSLADGPMKDALKKKGMPAMDELRTLLLPSTKTVMAIADKDFQKKRRTIRAVAGFRDALIEAAVVPNNLTSEQELDAAEAEVARNLSGLDRKGLRIMEKNRKTAEKEKIPEPERKGVEDANIMRLLAGYNALEIDPKLCAASRDHSKDMEEHKFFAHESPVPGKRTPWDRAKNFGTSGSGENIYMGSTDPLAANRGWFFSPGHHRNMFNPGHRRIGLGQHNRHWTQMFGR